jgi:3-oxoacyl-[acyl-carrier protein] reductase
MSGLHGKVLVVTGASRGIGAAVVRQAAAAGARVVFSYLHSEAEAKALLAAVNRERASDVAAALRSDVRDPAEVARLVQLAVERFGRVDVAVSNAHKPYTPRPLAETSWDEFQREIDTIVRGAFNLIQACVPVMKAQGGGAIVNVGSTMARSPRANHAFYVTAKRALGGLTESAALELGPYGVRVNLVSPGPLETDHNDSFTPEQMAKLGAETPLHRRLTTVEEVADAILLLASDQARVLTGAQILASGGFGIA